VRQAVGRAWVPVIPAAITLVVTLYRIQRPSLWRDEGATRAAVRRSLPQLLRMLAHADIVHGAYYLLMWFEIRAAGTSELALRFPSAVGMAVAAGGIAALGRRLVSTRAGLTAGLVFAALPGVSWYAENARSYALVTALATVASYLLVRAMAAGPGYRRRWLAGYAVTLAALGLGNLFALLLIPAHGLTLAAWIRRARPAPASAQPGAASTQPGSADDRSLVRGWLAAAAAALVVAAPVMIIAWAQRSQVNWIKPPGLATLGSLGQLLGPPVTALLVVLATVATVAFSALRGRLRTDWPSGLLAVSLPWVLLPPAVLLIVSLIHPLYSLRYVVFCAPAAALLAGVGMATLGWAGAAAGLAVVALTALPAQANLRTAGSHGENLRLLSQILARHIRPGDAVLFVSRNAREFGAAYPSGYRGLRDIGLGRDAVKSGTLLGTNAPAPVVRQRLTTVHRLWAIETGAQRGPLKVLHGLGFRAVHRWVVSHIWLVLYTHRTRPNG
jgi:mannosyltransferase